MFTDIKDYSPKTHRDEMNAFNLLRTHNQIMKEIIPVYNGWMVAIR
ncbi:MAG: hypothetical protein KJ799_10595 [Bacteroidetes bacterium]|nr:hypothetical protein [Bacteroidota bacterium]